MYLRLRAEGCTHFSLECVRRVCESDVHPETKQLLLEYIIGDLGSIAPLPPDRRAVDVKCCEYPEGDGIVVTVKADDGDVYSLACTSIGSETICFPYRPCSGEHGGGER